MKLMLIKLSLMFLASNKTMEASGVTNGDKLILDSHIVEYHV